MAKYQSTKVFDNYSVALRQHKAAHSHCELLHGYALKFKVWFESNEIIESKQLDEIDENTDIEILDKEIDSMGKQMEEKYKDLLSEDNLDSEK